MGGGWAGLGAEGAEGGGNVAERTKTAEPVAWYIQMPCSSPSPATKSGMAMGPTRITWLGLELGLGWGWG